MSILIAPLNGPIAFPHALDCNENKARAWWRIATEHCSEADSEIQLAMRGPASDNL